MSRHLQILPVEIAHIAMEVNSQTDRCWHYGLFEHELESDDLLAAQQRFTGVLSEAVLQSTQAGQSVLFIGLSLNAAASMLEQLERQVIFSKPEANLQLGTSKFSAIVIEGSFKYLDQLPLLRFVKNHLHPGGVLILFGEFLVDDSEILPAEIPNLSSLKQLSQRLGFALKEEKDCTESAVRSLTILEQKSEQLEQLSAKLSLIEAIHAIKDEFVSGRRCFSIFQFSYSPETLSKFPNAEFLANGEFTGTDIDKLFESSFGHQFDEELWRWKYAIGKGKSIAAKETPDGEIVSHYGGAPRDIYFFGALTKAIQVCDVMVAPAMRKYYGKSSLFFKSAATFLEREIGNSVGHLLGFGFPNQKAMNIALRLGLYEKTDDFIELSVSANTGTSSGATRLIDIDCENLSHQESVDELWQEMREECGDYIVGVRDWHYFEYRYFQHPTGKRRGYSRLFLVDALTDERLAALVLKEYGGETLLMDIICKPSDVALRQQQLLDSGLNNQIVGPLKFWITKAWVSRLELNGVVENNLGIEIPCNSWNKGPSAQSLYGKWWLTAVDMDFL